MNTPPSKSKVQRTFDVAEFSAKARHSLLKLKATQQPGQHALGSKSDVLNSVKDEIKQLMDEGYTARQIADAFSSDVFGILPKSITEIVEGKKKTPVKRAAKKQSLSARPAVKPVASTQPIAANKNVPGNAGSIVVTPDSEDL